MIKKVVGIAIAIVFLAALVPNLDAQTTVLSEDFEGSFPPSGWSTNYDGGQNQWYRNDYTNCSNYTGGGGFCACNDDDYWGYSVFVQNNSLVSAAFDATEYDEYELRFRYTWEDYRSEHAYVDYYDGEGWSQLDEMSTTGTSNGLLAIYDVTSEIGGMDDARFRWRYHDGTSNGWAYWYEVDAVEVIGEDTTGGPGEDSLDLDMVEIIRPRNEEDAGVAFRPACKVYSNLDGVIAKVICKIKKKTGGGYIYEDALNSVPLDEGYTDVDAFNYFTPEGGTHYNVLFVVEHEDDIDDSNNSMDKDWWGILGIDVTPYLIAAPAEAQVNGFAPSADYAEGAGAAVDADLIYTIEDVAYHAIVASDTIAHSFTANDTFTATFGEITLEDGNYVITFWAEDKGTNISHPEMSMPFGYTGIVEAPALETYTLDVVGNTVNYNIGAATDVSLRVYDAAGNLVTTLASGHHSAGSYSVNWNSNAASGIYFVKMITPDFSASDKLLRLY
jgi:hypothetical protein